MLGFLDAECDDVFTAAANLVIISLVCSADQADILMYPTEFGSSRMEY
jgi:hypothetical protein